MPAASTSGMASVPADGLYLMPLAASPVALRAMESTSGLFACWPAARSYSAWESGLLARKLWSAAPGTTRVSITAAFGTPTPSTVSRAAIFTGSPAA